MKHATRLFTLIAILAIASTSAHAANLVIPAAGSGPGANGSRWQTELTLHNASRNPITVTVAFHDDRGRNGDFLVTLRPFETVSFEDVITNRFGLQVATGALVVDGTDAAIAALVVNSRTINVAGNTEFGQEIPALPRDEASAAGDAAVIAGPVNPARSRFNFGLYTVEPTTIEWQLRRGDGSVAAEVTRQYDANIQLQYSNGIATLFAATAAANDVIHARVRSGRAFTYGSVINNVSGDPTFVQGIRTRQDLNVRFLGVDLDEDGIVDIADADEDGVLDQPVDVVIGYFPNYFRIVTNNPEGRPVTLAIADGPADARLIDDGATVQWVPAAASRGTSTTLRIVVSDGMTSSMLTIPVLFR